MNTKLARRYVDDGMAVTSKPQLVVRLYERVIADLERAIVALEGNEIEPAHNNLIHAQEILHELNLALDVEAWESARTLRAIYAHMTTLLIEANTTKRAEPVRQSLNLLEPLSDAWREAVATTPADRPGHG